MRFTFGMCAFILAMNCVVLAQGRTTPTLRPGISVRMPVASHSVEMRAADKEDPTVVTITEQGRLFIGIKPVEYGDLSRLGSGTVYVKADAQVPYQNFLTVLDSLRGRAIVLLTAPIATKKKGEIVAPYGISVRVGEQ